MADDQKKPVPSGESGLFHKDHHKEVIYFLLPGLFLISILINRFLNFWNSLEHSAAGSLWQKIFFSLLHYWSIWKGLALVLAFVSICICIYSFMKLRGIGKEEEKVFGHSLEEVSLDGENTESKENEKWVKILAHAHSENPAEWRLAIIEADIMLDELLTDLEYQGEGVGEKLKAVDPTDMLTLDLAWEAHKIRNRIAHSGQDFDLSERETRRVIKLFEEVFREFGVV